MKIKSISLIAFSSIALSIPVYANQELVDLFSLQNIKTPDKNINETFINKCGIRGSRIENLSQVACVQEAYGRWYVEHNAEQFNEIFNSYKKANFRERKAQENRFIDKCVEMRRHAGTYGVDIGCLGLLKGTLDVGLPRDEYGIINEEISIPTQNLEPSIKLGSLNGIDYTLLPMSILTNADNRIADISAFDTNNKTTTKSKLAVNCKTNMVTDDAGTSLKNNEWKWNKPRFNIEEAALNAICI